MDKQRVVDIIKRREHVAEVSQDEDNYGISQIDNELAELIASDVSAAIKFMCEDPDCSGNVFAWWSEVFDEVARKTQSREFVEALKVAARHFPEACASTTSPRALNSLTKNCLINAQKE